MLRGDLMRMETVGKFIVAFGVIVSASSALAIQGTDASGIITVSESISQISSTDWRYSYTFNNISAAGIWEIGVYSNFSNVSAVTSSFSNTTSAFASSGYADGNNTPGGYSSVAIGFSSLNGTSFGTGQSATLTFDEIGVNSGPTFNAGDKLFFAETSGNAAAFIDSTNGSRFSYIGYAPSSTPEPFTVGLGVAALAVAVRRRRKHA